MNTLRITQDTDAQDPRKEFDNLGTLYIANNRYFMGDENAEHPNEVDDIAVALNVYAYIHSGIVLNTSGFDCQWDSVQAGVIYITKETLIKEYGADTPENREKAERVLKAEVETFSQYLSGDVWGFEVIEKHTCDMGHEHEEVIDSCWGFYGSDPKENGMADHLEHKLEEYEIEGA